MNNHKEVILTGLRSNNNLHLGNYLGGLLPIIDIAKTRAQNTQINLFVPDLHSFTTPIDHSKLYESTLNNIKYFVAAGLPLNNPNTYIYRQSRIPAHSELAWILECFTGFGELSRMIEFKEKSNNLGVDHVGVGLFNYPVLMAADILLYDAQYVPVGEDQRQHLEFTREIAKRMNAKFNNLFVIPESTKRHQQKFTRDQAPRIKDLADPSKKMSKSNQSERGIIYLSDSPEDARKKIMSAETDSVGIINYDKDKQPGISNLLDIKAHLSGKEITEIVDEYKDSTNYADLKKDVADVVANFLEEFQANLDKIDVDAILDWLENSEKSMNEGANSKLQEVHKAIGLRQ